MADYNVNMKQWNGSSFDNVLPLAFNSKALDGKSYDDIIQYAQSKNLLLYTGQYTGTGTYGSSNPNSITFPFEPILLFTPTFGTANMAAAINVNTLKITYDSSYFYQGNSINAKKDGNTISWYASSAYNQLNDSGRIYYYAAIGGYDMGGQTEWTITSSGTWTVPKTGKYMLELYANGGYGGVVSPYSVTGGSSCQRYDSIQLTKGDVYVVTVAPYGSGNTSFGSDYSVSTAGNSVSSSNLGAGTGNLGTVGTVDFSGSSTTKNPSSGTLGQSYGFGAVTFGNQGTGAVYLKYLGE